MGGLLVAFLILVILILAVVVSCIKIVPQAHAYIVERLGGYLATWPVGLHLLIPFIDRVAKKVTLKEQVVDFPPQPVITKDNVTMQIDTVVLFPDHRSEAVCIRCGEPADGDREPDCNDTA